MKTRKLSFSKLKNVCKKIFTFKNIVRIIIVCFIGILLYLTLWNPIFPSNIWKYVFVLINAVVLLICAGYTIFSLVWAKQQHKGKVQNSTKSRITRRILHNFVYLTFLIYVASCIIDYKTEKAENDYFKADQLLGDLVTINSIYTHQIAMDMFSKLANNNFLDKDKRCDCYNNIALAYEKLATRKVISTDKLDCGTLILKLENNNINETIIDTITKDVIGGNYEDCIRCTQLFDTINWNNARDNYTKLYQLLQSFDESFYRKNPYISIKCFKNCAYFFLCDYLKFNGIEKLNLANESNEKAYELYQDKNVINIGKGNIEFRKKMIEKLLEEHKQNNKKKYGCN
ncbi:MAG: hypothetical protein LBN95_10350 [Prevotellaceae bacterium]|jgi:hypothetical protein|nr:hypothetical protein [Prevotellaceae bacterium]